MGEFTFYKYQPINLKNKVPPILIGIARLFDFTQVINKPGNKSPNEIDLEAIASDWQTIGDDLRNTFKKYKNN